jgi:tetratricopeptide (TPR) repeat protein
MPADWFRNAAWDEAAQADFYTRLARARRKAEYMRIKGVYLYDAGEVQGAVALWSRVVEENSHDLSVNGALEKLGDAYQRLGDRRAAEDSYRSLMARVRAEGRAWGSSGLTGVSLAEVLLDSGTAPAAGEAGTLLDEASQVPHLRLSSSLFLRYLVARARWAELSGRADPRPPAREALELADDGRAAFVRDDGAYARPATELLETARRLAS